VWTNSHGLIFSSSMWSSQSEQMALYVEAESGQL